MVAFNSGPLLHFADLPTGVANGSRVGQPTGLAMAASASNASEYGNLRTASNPAPSQTGVFPLQQVERRAIEQALAYTRGDRTTAAHLLGIGRTTLYRKLKEYGYPAGAGAHMAGPQAVDGNPIEERGVNGQASDLPPAA
jgi:DNA-binding NtrC family response regulator